MSVHPREGDAFDLAAVIDRHGPRLQAHLGAVEDRLDRLIDRLDALSATYQGAAIDEVNATESGSRYAKDEAIKSAIAFLINWRESGAAR